MAATLTLPKKDWKWDKILIRMLRGERSLAEFGKLVGVPWQTVARWERHWKHRPEPVYARRLSALANKERFLKDWKLAGSATLFGDLKEADLMITKLFQEAIERSARELIRG